MSTENDMFDESAMEEMNKMREQAKQISINEASLSGSEEGEEEQDLSSEDKQPKNFLVEDVQPSSTFDEMKLRAPTQSINRPSENKSMDLTDARNDESPDTKSAVGNKPPVRQTGPTIKPSPVFRPPARIPVRGGKPPMPAGHSRPLPPSSHLRLQKNEEPSFAVPEEEDQKKTPEHRLASERDLNDDNISSNWSEIKGGGSRINKPYSTVNEGDNTFFSQPDAFARLNEDLLTTDEKRQEQLNNDKTEKKDRGRQEDHDRIEEEESENTKTIEDYPHLDHLKSPSRDMFNENHITFKPIKEDEAKTGEKKEDDMLLRELGIKVDRPAPAPEKQEVEGHLFGSSASLIRNTNLSKLGSSDVRFDMSRQISRIPHAEDGSSPMADASGLRIIGEENTSVPHQWVKSGTRP